VDLADLDFSTLGYSVPCFQYGRKPDAEVKPWEFTAALQPRMSRIRLDGHEQNMAIPTTTSTPQPLRRKQHGSRPNRSKAICSASTASDVFIGRDERAPGCHRNAVSRPI
jgi:hypothetical protein